MNNTSPQTQTTERKFALCVPDSAIRLTVDQLIGLRTIIDRLLWQSTTGIHFLHVASGKATIDMWEVQQ